MDPRLKLNYYEENDWEQTYIDEAKETVFEVWETVYKVDDLVNEQHDEIEDELFSHIFKKRKISRKDELTEYLKEPVVQYSTDVLLWWKVCFIINYK
jgi:hypothetical protein